MIAGTRERANRVTNFDRANLVRLGGAARAQRDAIAALDLNGLDPRLRQVAELAAPKPAPLPGRAGAAGPSAASEVDRGGADADAHGVNISARSANRSLTIYPFWGWLAKPLLNDNMCSVLVGGRASPARRIQTPSVAARICRPPAITALLSRSVGIPPIERLDLPPVGDRLGAFHERTGRNQRVRPDRPQRLSCNARPRRGRRGRRGERHHRRGHSGPPAEVRLGARPLRRHDRARRRRSRRRRQGGAGAGRARPRRAAVVGPRGRGRHRVDRPLQLRREGRQAPRGRSQEGRSSAPRRPSPTSRSASA